MERLGEILKQTRLEKSLTIEQVENDTKIRRQYIEAMENEQWDFFSNYVFLKNFLRTYCRYLNLDKSDYINYLISELKPKPVPPKIEEKVDMSTTPHRNAGILLSIIALILLFTTSYIYQQYLFPVQREPDVSQVEEKQTKENLTENEAEPIEQNPVETETELPVTPPEIKEINLTLKCLDDRCWVEVKNNAEEIIYQRTIVKGEEISFTDEQKLSIKLGNAGQVQVFINEEDLGILGSVGEVVTKTYVLENNNIIEL